MKKLFGEMEIVHNQIVGLIYDLTHLLKLSNCAYQEKR